jgi:hypothetical protein
MLCFAAQNVPRKMDGEGLPRDGFETVPGVLGSCSDRLRTVNATSGVVLPTLSYRFWRKSSTKAWLHILNCQFLRKVSHGSFVSTSSTFSFFEGSITRKFRFHIFNFSFFEGSIARKFRFHIFNFKLLTEVSHESFVFTTWSCRSIATRSRQLVLAEFSHLWCSSFFF